MVLGYSDGGAFLCPREVGVGILMIIIISYRPTWCLRVGILMMIIICYEATFISGGRVGGREVAGGGGVVVSHRDLG